MEKRQRKMSQNLKNKIWSGSILVAFVAAIAVFVFLLQTEKKALAGYEKEQVCIVQNAIPRGEEITPENADQYITTVQIDQKIVPEAAIRDITGVVGKTAICGIGRGTVLTSEILQELSIITGNMKEPVIAGFRAEDLYQVAGGVLRAGDKIHIYCVGSEDELSDGKLLWENISVQQVFDQTGKPINGGDRVTPAQRINIYLEKEDISQFYDVLSQGSLRAVKACEMYSRQ